MLEFNWVGKGVSLNEWYSSKHWTKRVALANKWHLFFRSMVPIPMPRFETYYITMEYNSKIDASNSMALIKLLEDMMQKYGIIENDNKMFCRGITIIPNLTLKHNEYKIRVE